MKRSCLLYTLFPVLRFLPFFLLSFLLFIAPVSLYAEPLYSPTWGFRLDLPEGYSYLEGNNIDRYSFQGPDGAMFDIAVYSGVYQGIEQMSLDIGRRLDNKGDTAFFDYGGKAAALIELRFRDSAGWGLCVELSGGGGEKNPPLLLALAYAPAAKNDMDIFHLSALDSIAPSEAERLFPGPVTEFSYPRGRQKETAVAATGLRALIYEHDAEAAQALVDREFSLLIRYQSSKLWKEAWIRYYRAIYRDSWDRVSGAVSALARNWASGAAPDGDSGERAFAEKALSFVQDFEYERVLAGSDFINLVTAVTEGRGDCDSRAMLWAMILIKADIPAAMMVSRSYSHAMGLAGIPGGGARYESGGINWLVAETTGKVGLGLINADMSDTANWIGVLFE